MKEINNINELKQAKDFDLSSSSKVNFTNLKVNFQLDIAYDFFSDFINSLNSINPLILNFKGCTFSKGITFLVSTVSHEFNFKDCHFHDESRFQNIKFEKNIRFHECHFKGITNFKNTRFEKLADFGRSSFYKKVIFYKTDFLGTAVFSAVTFKENVLFTYALLKGKTIFRRTKVIKGIDLSLAIIGEDIAIYDFKIPDFFVLLQEQADEVYERNVSKNGDIPIKNKRETFRIIKQIHESNSNVVESLPFRRLEKETLAKELSLKSGFFNFFDKIILCLNKCSNSYGTSIAHSLVFIIVVGWLFFYFSLIATDSFEFSFDFRLWEFKKGVSYFVQYLLPTHKFNYMGESVKLTPLFYVFDFLGRTLVGYGIYQFIQAFRKYR